MKYIINIDTEPYTNPSENLKQYEIDIDVLRRKGNIYDSLIIDNTARVIRRIKHENGEDYILQNPITENLKMINIMLNDGVNYIYVTVDGKILASSTMVVDYLLKNDFTDTFPTTIEMYSAISQTANSITLEVNQKFDEEFTAANIILKINNDVSEAQINADKISLAGKEINLTSDNIVIKSNNFSVDKNGNMTCSNANITGGSLKCGSNFSVDKNGNMTCSNANITGGNINIGNNFIVRSDGSLELKATSNQNYPALKINHYFYPIGGTPKLSSYSVLDGYGLFFSFPDGSLGSQFDASGAIVDGIVVNDSIHIPNNATAGYGLCNANGVSIIRDHNNQNVTVDATGSTLFLGYQTTTGINILNGKINVDSNGNFKATGSIYLDTGSIRSKATYNSNTVTNAPNLYISSNGNIRRTTNSSSYKIKKDIKRYKKENNINEELNPEKLYDLKVWQFKYRDEYFENKNDRRYNKDLIGFILEDMARKYPIAVDYEDDENGIPRPESWNSQYLIPPMMYLIQELHKEVEELKSLVKGDEENGMER